MIPSNTSRVKRLRGSGDRVLLDEKRLKDIRRRIADGYYDRNDVCRSIVERLVDRLSSEDEEVQD